MAGPIFEILARLKLNASEFGTKLNSELDKAEKKAGSAGGVIGKNISEGIGGGLQDAAAKVPIIGNYLTGLSGPALGAAAAVGAIASAIAVGISEAETLHKSLRGLDRATAGTNRTGLSRQQLIDFSQEMESRFGMVQAEILDSVAAMALFDGVSGETFTRAIKAAKALATAYDTDLRTEAETLGRVLQNLAVGSVEGLRKAYAELPPPTRAAIEALNDLGRTAEAQEKLLAALEEQAGKAGGSNAKGVTGAYFRMRQSATGVAREFVTQTGIYDNVAKGLGRIADMADHAAKRMKAMNEAEVAGRALMMWLPGGSLVNRMIPAPGTAKADRPNFAEMAFQMAAKISAAEAKRQQQVEARLPQLRREVEASRDGAVAATQKYEDALKSLDEQLRRNQISEAEYKEAMLAASRTRDRETEAARRKPEKDKIQLLAPVEGPVTSGFGRRARPTAGASAYHPAIDYGVPVGTSVRAGADGVVIKTGTMRGLGKVVVIDYGNNIEAQFSHLSEALVNPGDVVERGQVVARSGNTGITTGPHLDYRVKQGGSYVDPRGRAFDLGAGVGNAYASFEQQQEKAAAAELEAQEKILKAMRDQFDVEVESVRYAGLRAQGLDRQADMEEQIAALQRRGAEQLAQLPEEQGRVTDGLQDQLSILWNQAGAFADLLKANGDRAALNDADRAAEAAAAAAVEDALGKARDMAAKAADQLAIDEAILQVKLRIAGATEDGAKAAREARDADEAVFRKEVEARRDMFDMQREQYQDLADFYERAMRSGGKSIVEDFKDQMLSSIAQIAAQWTMALLSGQKVSFGSLLQNMGATTGGGGSNPLAMLFGGGGQSGTLADLLQKAPGGGVGGGVTKSWFGGPAEAGLSAAVKGGGGAAAGGMGGLAASIGQAMPYFAAATAAASLMNKVLGINDPTGGFLGPLGALAVNSFIPAKRGSASLGFDAYGGLSVGSTRGNSDKRIGAASDALGQGIDMLNRIAEALGGTLGGSPSGSLGMRDGSWRFDPTGRGITKTKNGAIDFGEDLEAAVRAFVKDGLQDGLVGGITAAQKAILASGQDLEKAIEKAAMIGDIPRRLAAQLDPVGAELEAFHKGWDKQIAALKEGGATAAEMADAHKLYKLELEDVKNSTREAAASLKDFLDDLNFGSSSPYSLRDQERLARESLQPWLDKIGTGERIAQEKYLAAAKSFLDIERELYGSTGDFFKSMDMIRAATGKAIADIDNAKPIRTFADPFAEATASNTAAIANINDQMNQRLGDLGSKLDSILAALGGGGSGFIGGAKGFSAASV